MSSHRIEIIKELRALEQFCTFKVMRTGDESERFLKDYLADIQDFPLQAIQAACADWRKSGQTKFPTPGQLIPMIRSRLQTKAAPKDEAWVPLDDADYAALTLDGKERHHLILAKQALDKAGPMWRDGRALHPDEMSAEHNKWKERARFHKQEASRLRAYKSKYAAQ